jgi:hypothetical protein
MAKETVDGESFRFDKPRGWVNVRSNLGKAKAGLYRGESKNPDGHIEIVAVAPTLGVETVAKSLAKDYGGTVLAEQVTVDGEKGLRVRSPASAGEIKPVEIIVVMHTSSVYLIMVGARPGMSVIEDLEHIRSTWTWKPSR